MIHAIAAMDAKRGIGGDHGIPWHLPADRAYFKEQTTGTRVLMGHHTYTAFDRPLADRRNLVVVHDTSALRPGFEPVVDVDRFLKTTREDVWIIGGARLFANILHYVQELYLTEIQADFHCTKFFPLYQDAFRLVSRSGPITENGTTYTFCIYERK